MFAILFFDSSNNNTKRKRSVILIEIAFKFQKKEKKGEAKVKNNYIKFNFIQNNFFKTIHKIEERRFPFSSFPSNEKFSFSRR